MTLTLTQKIGKWNCYTNIVVYKLRIIAEKDDGTQNLSHEIKTSDTNSAIFNLHVLLQLNLFLNHDTLLNSKRIQLGFKGAYI
ncbi:hypothetical protein VNO80_14949 [Phaseolus coccineus]|uniref:Uncharacterized protein n=1 Tax=Phaseolus coccineus TaxID=3886 RepID=A0AAN9MMS1_PHACN